MHVGILDGLQHQLELTFQTDCCSQICHDSLELCLLCLFLQQNRAALLNTPFPASSAESILNPCSALDQIYCIFYYAVAA